MQVHAGAGMRPFTHDARDQGDFLEIKLVSKPLHSDGFDEGIRHDDFFLAARGRVAVVGCFDVGAKEVADAREVAEKFQGDSACDRAELLFGDAFGSGVIKGFGDFILKPAGNGVHERNHLNLQFGGMNDPLIEEAGKNQAKQVVRDGGDGRFGRQVLAIDVINATGAGIGEN